MIFNETEHIVDKGLKDNDDDDDNDDDVDDDDGGEIGFTQVYVDGPIKGILKNTLVQGEKTQNLHSLKAEHDVQ